MPFDEERYALIRTDEQLALSADKIIIASGGTALNIFGLGADDTGAFLIVSLRRLNLHQKLRLRIELNL